MGANLKKVRQTNGSKVLIYLSFFIFPQRPTLVSTAKRKISKSNKSSKNVAKSRDQAIIQKRELQAAIANVDKLTSEIEIVKSKLSKTNEDLKKHSEFIPIYQEIDRLNIEINLFEVKLSEHSQDRVEESKVAWKVLIWEKAGPMYEEFKKISMYLA